MEQNFPTASPDAAHWANFHKWNCRSIRRIACLDYVPFWGGGMVLRSPYLHTHTTECMGDIWSISLHVLKPQACTLVLVVRETKILFALAGREVLRVGPPSFQAEGQSSRQLSRFWPSNLLLPDLSHGPFLGARNFICECVFMCITTLDCSLTDQSGSERGFSSSCSAVKRRASLEETAEHAQWWWGRVFCDRPLCLGLGVGFFFLSRTLKTNKTSTKETCGLNYFFFNLLSHLFCSKNSCSAFAFILFFLVLRVVFSSVSLMGGRAMNLTSKQ